MQKRPQNFSDYASRYSGALENEIANESPTQIRTSREAVKKSNSQSKGKTKTQKNQKSQKVSKTPRTPNVQDGGMGIEKILDKAKKTDSKKSKKEKVPFDYKVKKRNQKKSDSKNRSQHKFPLVPSPPKFPNVIESPYDPIIIKKNLVDADIKCDICLDLESEEDDQIVICELCWAGTHQRCYGGELLEGIPEKDWYCERCQRILEQKMDCNAVKCFLCDEIQGIIKKVNSSLDLWAHVICVNWTPDIFFCDETVSNIDGLYDKERFSLQCLVCRKQYVGSCIQCDYKNCKRSYHVRCAVSRGLIYNWAEMKKDLGEETVSHLFCPEHMDAGQREIFGGGQRIIQDVKSDLNQGISENRRSRNKLAQDIMKHKMQVQEKKKNYKKKAKKGKSPISRVVKKEPHFQGEINALPVYNLDYQQNLEALQRAEIFQNQMLGMNPMIGMNQMMEMNPYFMNQFAMFQMWQHQIMMQMGQNPLFQQMPPAPQQQPEVVNCYQNNKPPLTQKSKTIKKKGQQIARQSSILQNQVKAQNKKVRTPSTKKKTRISKIKEKLNSSFYFQEMTPKQPKITPIFGNCEDRESSLVNISVNSKVSINHMSS